ncbi:hypothetical protein [Corallococcus aberystwythensis]|uniref:Uncharacterized protein n=1 Tax=Corallococcus aberystwythensis TaxID=2316722 RepID=A0A3A8PIG3_9BACT|nr:hypothetical protein [Corallococcus aberystwythensis]RKH56127.1 hypothetical protein D7W81_34750 [Corallococcus aberystwythensis]
MNIAAPRSERSSAQEPPSSASGTTTLDQTTWNFVNTIYCYQSTGHNCYVGAWSPRCPSDPEAKECWNPNTICYRVADDYEVEVFECR